MSAFEKPAFGKIALTNFPKGFFTVIFDNALPYIQSTRHILSRCWITDSQQVSHKSSSISLSEPDPDCILNEYYSELSLGKPIRLSFYISSAFQPESKIVFSWNFTDVSIDSGVQFIILYETQVMDDVASVSSSMDLPITEVQEEPMPSQSEESPADTSEMGSKTTGTKSMVQGILQSQQKLPLTKSFLIGKASHLIGKAKEAYQEVKTVYKDSSQLPLRTRAAAMKTAATAAIVRQESKTTHALGEETQSLIGSKKRTTSITLLQSSSLKHAKGELDITGKAGCYTLVLEKCQRSQCTLLVQVHRR
jgi:hypothetical protein